MAKKLLTRREALYGLGISIGLPLLESAFPFRWALAANNPKKRFIGCFFPSGAAMPDGANGDWTLAGALSPVVQAGMQNNVAIMRGFRSVNHGDVHWTGTASFLSCNLVGLNTTTSGTRAGERCGKSFDQYVADLEQTKIRSLHAGWHTVPGWDEGHDRTYSIQYVNCIAWKTDRSPIQNTMDSKAMFTQVFGDGTTAADPQIQYLLRRKKSVLDGVLGQLKSFRATIAPDDRARMDSFEQSIREVETEIGTAMSAPGANTCGNTGLDVSDPSAYLQSMGTMQKIIVRALQCNVTRSATIMYHEGIGDSEVRAGMSRQHDCAHNDWTQLQVLNRIQTKLWADLLVDLKNSGLLDETVAILGSNMSDGRSHNSANAPFLVAGNGGGLKLGQEIYGTSDVMNNSANRTIADIYMDLFKLYGIPQASYGEGADQSTGKPSGITG